MAKKDTNPQTILGQAKAALTKEGHTSEEVEAAVTITRGNSL